MLHIRRGDYVKLAHFHKNQSLDYYKNSVEFIINNKLDKSLFNNIELTIFSDDIEWCKKNLDINYPKHFIKLEKDYEELYLMSKFKYNIITNSSFSWLATYFNTIKDKIIVAPKTWYVTKDNNLDDLFLPNTIVL